MNYLTATPTAEWKDPQRGYVILSGCHGHHLADRKGNIKRHRLVCWEFWGDSHARESSCHWCGYILPWRTTKRPASSYCVNVDHVNGIKGDDRADNLVPACGWCNSNRRHGDLWAKIIPSFADVAPWDRPWPGRVWC